MAAALVFQKIPAAQGGLNEFHRLIFESGIAGLYSGWMWDLAFQGDCNCTDTTGILAVPRTQFVTKAVGQGALFGTALGAIAGAGPAGGIVSSLVGIGFSTVGVMDSAVKLRDNINDKCAWLEFGMSLLGLGVSGAGYSASYN